MRQDEQEFSEQKFTETKFIMEPYPKPSEWSAELVEQFKIELLPERLLLEPKSYTTEREVLNKKEDEGTKFQGKIPTSSRRNKLKLKRTAGKL